MPRYKILAISFIDNRLVQPDEIITVAETVIPGQHWQPLDPAAKKAFKAAGFGKATAITDPELKAPLASDSDNEGDDDGEPGSPSQAA